MEILFGKKLNRLKLLNPQKKENDKNITISIYRNHSFEMISSVINSFLKFSNLFAEFNFSDYDDSLNFQFKEANFQIIWLDLDRYKTNNLEDFILERANVLRTQTNSPILIATVGKKEIIISNLPSDCYIININKELQNFGENIYDIAKEPFSGTKLSNKACLEFARILGLRYIPAILQTPIKAIVVDLDNTLYKGILGEDGIKNLIPNIEFQQQLKFLKEQGFFLCIASKNEEVDVKEMFDKRKDFILKLEDFTTYQINWNNKADNIIKIAKALNIGLDSILFIDDNPAEIQNVEYLGIKTILALDNISQILKYYPGLLKLKTSSEDNIRSKDIQANEKRQEMLKNLSKEEYFKKLGIKLEYGINISEQIQRVAELLNKTNQFILSYVRYNETQVKKFLTDTNNILVTIKMSDNLSDSGVIAILLASKEDNNLVIKELTVSCRALGRNLEDIMLPYLFNIAYKELNASKDIKILYKKGERNMPALNWLKMYSGAELEINGAVILKNNENIYLDGLKIEVFNGKS